MSSTQHKMKGVCVCVCVHARALCVCVCACAVCTMFCVHNVLFGQLHMFPESRPHNYYYSNKH